MSIASKATIFAIGLAISLSAAAATATFTGQMSFATSVTGQQVVRCQYRYMSQTFWATIRGASCPATIEVQ